MSLRGLAAVLLLVCAVSRAGPASDARSRAFAKLPYWSGIWIADDGLMSDLGLSGFSEQPNLSKHILSGPAPFTPAWSAKVAAFRVALRSAPGKECGFYFPLVMEAPWVFQFLITPEETTMIFGGREIRHVYTDGRGHPDADSIWATPWGDSVGRWEGDTLVIDTIAVQPSHIPLGPLLSEQAHFSERIRMTAAGRIEDRMTIEDPVAFTKPWTVTVPYKRVAALDRLVHGDCQENDRNPIIDGKLTITPAR